jgi:hypothetical protein
MGSEDRQKNIRYFPGKISICRPRWDLQNMRRLDGAWCCSCAAGCIAAVAEDDRVIVGGGCSAPHAVGPSRILGGIHIPCPQDSTEFSYYRSET